MEDKRYRFTLGGGSYMLIGIGTGLAVSSWGEGFFNAAVAGLFWPVTLAYWVMQVLHRLAA